MSAVLIIVVLLILVMAGLAIRQLVKAFHDYDLDFNDGPELPLDRVNREALLNAARKIK